MKKEKKDSYTVQHYTKRTYQPTTNLQFNTDFAR